MGRIAVVLGCVLVALGVRSHAQAPQALPIEQSRFDVASVKPIGLKLEAAERPLAVIVIDSVERPTSD